MVPLFLSLLWFTFWSGDTRSCIPSSINNYRGVQSCSICSKTSFSGMEKHTCYNSSACNVQASRTHQERHGECQVVYISSVFMELLLFSMLFCFLFQDKLAFNITTEQGKTLKDAQGDVFRGLG